MSNRENRGKQFEEQIRTALEAVPNTYVLRLPDPQSGFLGVRNVCDFIAYNSPALFLIECKSCYGNTLPFSNITASQWQGLREAADTEGIVAGYMVWFIDHDRTVFIPAKEMVLWHFRGKKSINIKDIDTVLHIDIPGKKKRILFEYDLSAFIDEGRINRGTY